MRYGSVCSGVAPQTDDWAAMGLECAWFSEIEPFPSAVLAYRHPAISNLGDFTQIGIEDGCPVDLLVGGTPCQDFSVAGLRAGMDGKRGQLTVEFLKLAGRLRPQWVVWENVPGVLSIDEGRAFGEFLGLLGKFGYGFAYRILDAQYFGVAQRRRRVFVVGCLGDWRRAAAVLFERESLSGHPPPRREKGERTPSGVEIGPSGGGFTDLSPTLDSRAKDGFIRNQLGVGAFVPELVGTLSDGAHMGGGLNGQDAYSGRIIASIQSVNMVRERKQNGIGISEDAPMYSLTGRDQHAVAFNSRQDPIDYGNPEAGWRYQSMAVRRLTPRETERLQGMPDDYTLVPYNGKPASDGPRYKAIGNSWAVPVLNWIAKRIIEVERLTCSNRQ